MADYMPLDLLIDILARLPVKSLLRCRAVCKAWYSLIASPKFISLHLRRSISHIPPRLIFNYISGRQRRYTLRLDNANIELESPFPALGNTFTPLGSCNGLLCLSNRMDDIVLWNPTIRRVVAVPPSPGARVPGLCRKPFGFGFDSRTQDYKLLEIGIVFDPNCGGCRLSPRAEIYALSTQSWRTIEVDGFFDKLDDCGSSHAFVNGAIHCVGFGRDSLLPLIVAFHLGEEVFREVALPNCFLTSEVVVDVREHFDIAVFGESLAVTHHKLDLISETVDVWEMEKHGVVQSWTKKITITTHVPQWRFLGFRNIGHDVLMFRTEGRELVSYDPKSQETMHFGIYGDLFSSATCVYTLVESLVGLDAANGNSHAAANVLVGDL